MRYHKFCCRPHVSFRASSGGCFSREFDYAIFVSTSTAEPMCLGEQGIFGLIEYPLLFFSLSLLSSEGRSDCWLAPQKNQICKSNLFNCVGLRH